MDSFSTTADRTSSSQPSTSSFATASQSQADFAVGKYGEDYLSTDDILALSQRVACNFERSVQGLGFIDPATESNDVTVNTKVEIPLWLAKVLHSRKLVSIEVPKGYNETYREILDADSTVVDLHKLGPRFYSFGKHLVGLNIKESEDIAKSLVNTFHQRFHKLLDYSLSVTSDTGNEMLQYQSTLDDKELDILATGKKSTEEFKRWEKRANEKVTANEMVATFKKRKRAACEADVELKKSLGQTSQTQSSSSSQQQ